MALKKASMPTFFNRIQELLVLDALWGKLYWSVYFLVTFSFTLLSTASIFNEPTSDLNFIEFVIVTFLIAIFYSVVSLFVFIGPFLLIRFFVKRNTRNKKKSKSQHKKSKNNNAAVDSKKEITVKNNGLTIARRVAVIALIFGIIFYVPISHFVILTVNEIQATPEIKDIATNSGFNINGKLLFYATNPQLISPDELKVKCQVKDDAGIEYGCYDPNTNRMYILRVNDPNYAIIEYTTAAHETLHAAWEHTSTDELKKLSDKIKVEYNDSNNADVVQLHETMKLYGQDGSTNYNELHSFLGSEVQTLNADLEDYYSKYFGNRLLPVQSSKNFNARLDKEESDIDTLASQLDTEKAELDGFKAQYLDRIEAYMQTNIYYGDTYTYNKNVDAYNHNLEIYKSRIATYNNAIGAYNNRIASYNALLASFRPSSTPLNIRQ